MDLVKNRNDKNKARLATLAVDLDYVDFGCGVGKSMSFANALVPGMGRGVDKSEDAVAACRAKGYDAEVGDILTYEARNIAGATFAIDLMQELSGRQDLNTACVNLVRAARNFAVIQHSYFDIDAVLAPLGFYCEANFHKKITYKPTVADYAIFAKTYAKATGIIGIGVFAFGEPVVTPIFDDKSSSIGSDIIMARSLRVVMARKDPRRFQQALQKVAIGRTLFVWTQE